MGGVVVAAMASRSWLLHQLHRAAGTRLQSGSGTASVHRRAIDPATVDVTVRHVVPQTPDDAARLNKSRCPTAVLLSRRSRPVISTLPSSVKGRIRAGRRLAAILGADVGAIRA